MRYAFLLLLCLSYTYTSIARQFNVLPLKIDTELSDPENQFSGLFIYGKTLYMMSESRVQNHAEAKLYAISLAGFTNRPDTSQEMHGQKIPLIGLDTLGSKISDYEGLEAFVITRGGTVYFSVETHTGADNCYLLKGRLADSSVIMDTRFILPLPKPTLSNGKHVFNAGFEALGEAGNSFYIFYEYNSFANRNSACLISNDKLAKMETDFQAIPFLKPLPFRLTDITVTAPNSFTGVNYFYAGGSDSIYRPETTDTTNNRLVKQGNDYSNYCRLITISIAQKGISWEPLGILPQQYFKYNIEGIAAYKDGYFLINDKYSPSKPYRSQLLFVF